MSTFNELLRQRESLDAQLKSMIATNNSDVGAATSMSTSYTRYSPLGPSPSLMIANSQPSNHYPFFGSGSVFSYTSPNSGPYTGVSSAVDAPPSVSPVQQAAYQQQQQQQPQQQQYQPQQQQQQQYQPQLQTYQLQQQLQDLQREVNTSFMTLHKLVTENNKQAKQIETLENKVSILSTTSLSENKVQKEHDTKIKSINDRVCDLENYNIDARVRDLEDEVFHGSAGDSERESDKDPNEDSDKDPNEDSDKDSNGDSNKDSNGDSNKDSNGDSNKDSNGDSNKDKVSNGDSNKDSNGDSNKDDEDFKIVQRQKNNKSKSDEQLDIISRIELGMTPTAAEVLKYSPAASSPTNRSSPANRTSPVAKFSFVSEATKNRIFHGVTNIKESIDKNRDVIVEELIQKNDLMQVSPDTCISFYVSDGNKLLVPSNHHNIHEIKNHEAVKQGLKYDKFNPPGAAIEELKKALSDKDYALYERIDFTNNKTNAVFIVYKKVLYLIHANGKFWDEPENR
jgi:hypothetical protein